MRDNNYRNMRHIGAIARLQSNLTGHQRLAGNDNLAFTLLNLLGISESQRKNSNDTFKLASIDYLTVNSKLTFAEPVAVIQVKDMYSQIMNRLKFLLDHDGNVLHGFFKFCYTHIKHQDEDSYAAKVCCRVIYYILTNTEKFKVSIDSSVDFRSQLILMIHTAEKLSSSRFADVFYVQADQLTVNKAISALKENFVNVEMQFVETAEDLLLVTNLTKGVRNEIIKHK